MFFNKEGGLDWLLDFMLRDRLVCLACALLCLDFLPVPPVHLQAVESHFRPTPPPCSSTPLPIYPFAPPSQQPQRPPSQLPLADAVHCGGLHPAAPPRAARPPVPHQGGVVPRPGPWGTHHACCAPCVLRTMHVLLVRVLEDVLEHMVMFVVRPSLRNVLCCVSVCVLRVRSCRAVQMIEFFELLHVRFDFDGALEKLAVCGACCSCHLFVLLSLHAPEVCSVHCRRTLSFVLAPLYSPLAHLILWLCVA